MMELFIKLEFLINMIDIQLLKYLESYLTEKRLNRFNEVISQRTKHFTVATEDVYHLHNTSAVMRSCDVFGVQELSIIEEQGGKRIDREIALGAQKWVDLNRFDTALECIQDMKSKGYQIVATTPHTDDCLLQDFDVTKKSCFIFGRETEGLTQDVLDNADCYLKIPMVGFTESLNVSVSAAIILQSVMSRLKQTDVKWQLTEEEKNSKKLDWIKKTIHSYDKIVARFYNSK